MPACASVAMRMKTSSRVVIWPMPQACTFSPCFVFDPESPQTRPQHPPAKAEQQHRYGGHFMSVLHTLNLADDGALEPCLRKLEY